MTGAAADVALEERIAKMVTLMEQGSDNEELVLHLGLLRNEHDGKGFNRLCTHLARILECCRSWHAVIRNTDQIFVRGHPDGSTQTMIGTQRSDQRSAEEKEKFISDQQRLVQRTAAAINLLGTLMHLRAD